MMKLRFDDYKRVSHPYQVCNEVKVISLAVGFDHYMMIDKAKQLWSVGENTNGCMGTGDNKYRIVPWRNLFFENKRVVDVACGDRFTVVIAETFNKTKLPIEYGNPHSKFFSTKCLVNSTKTSICDQSGNTGNHVPDDLR